MSDVTPSGARWGADWNPTGSVDPLACAKNANVNGTGGVTIADAQLIGQLIAGRIPSLPPP